MDVIIKNANLILELNPKYKSIEDLIKRLNWLKAMNMEYPAMPLTKNHELVLEAFDEFNKLIGNDFDVYYTGGIMGYLATNQQLERYHGDLDLFINEEQLDILKKIIDESHDFVFVSNMNHKEVNGHEYKIVYKDSPMSIGLFLFERKKDQSITVKEYYFDNKDKNSQLFVDETHFTKTYTDMCFSDEVRYHNGIAYKMMSLESIYNSKKNSRPKDRYDAAKIEKNIDIVKSNKIELEKQNNKTIIKRPLETSIIHSIEKNINIINQASLQTYLNSRVSIYLEMIEKEYGQYMSEEQKILLKSLKLSENVVVETSADKWIENQIQAIKNDSKLSEEQKQKEIEEIKNHKITAHGGNVFKDQKIHFYPFNIRPRENETLESVCEGILVHELFHYFISPKYMNIQGVENSDKLNSYIAEGLVDMCARDLMLNNNVLNTYTSNYTSNVIFMRENLQKLESKTERMNLIFQGDMKQITSKLFYSQEDLVQKYNASKNKKTIFDNMVRQVAFVCGDVRIESAIYNISANSSNKKDAANNIKDIGGKIYQDKKEKIIKIVNNYSENEEQNIYKEKQQSMDEERQNLLQQKRYLERKKQLMEQKNQIESIKNNEVNNTQQNNMDKPMMRKLTPNKPTQNSGYKNGFTNILLLSLITSGFIMLVALLTFLIIK